MISSQALLMFLAVTTVYSLVPGPAVMLSVSQAMTHGTRAALRGVAGIMLVNLGLCLLAALGVGLLVEAYPRVFKLIQWVGAAYLVWIAVQTIRNPITVERLQANRASALTGRQFWDGVVVQASNPKAIFYVTAFLPQFADPVRGSVGWQMAELCFIGSCIDGPVLAAYAWLGNRAVSLMTRPAYAQAFAWMAGLLLMGAAAGVSGVFA